MPWRTNTYQREKLYEEVWAEPVSTVAKRYGISGVAIAKKCRKLEVPLPPRGYWAKIQAGRKIPRRPLPSFRGDTTITSSIWVIEEPVQTEAERIVESELNVTIPSPVPVPEELRRPHPLVEQTRTTYRGLKPYDNGVIWCRQNVLDLRVSPACLSRALRIYDGLIKAMEALGWQTNLHGQEKDNTSVTVLGQTIQFGIEEDIGRTEHVPTPQEERKKARGEYFRKIRWDYHPTGKLRVRIKEYGNGFRKSWSDTPRHRVEERLETVIKEIGLYAARKLARHRESERKAREKEAIRCHLAEFQAQRDAAKRRIAQLETDAGAWQKSQLVRAFVEATRLAEIHDEEWIRWALAYANHIDPLRTTPPPISEKSQEEIELEKKLQEYRWY